MQYVVRPVVLLIILTLVPAALRTSQAAVADLSVGPYTLISSKRVSRTLFDYTYRAQVTNPGTVEVLNVSATVRSTAATTRVMDDSLTFGDVGAGMMQTSTDTFTVRQNRTVPLNPASLVWTVSGNSRPVANAGVDHTAFVGETVTLDGSSSTDVDGDGLSHVWTLLSKPPGSTTGLGFPTAVNPVLLIDKPGTYEIRLVVNDGHADSAPDLVRISTENSRPVAYAGPDQTTFVDQTVQLEGSGSSDVDGDQLIYHWTLISQPPASTTTLENAMTAQPFLHIDEPGTYEIQLIVNDGALDSVPDTIVISTQNSAPVADAGEDQVATVLQPVQLDGRSSYDPDGDPLASYLWSFTTVPLDSAAALSDPTISQPVFIPDLPGMYVVQLIVNDGQVDSAPDTAKVTVVVAGCTPGTTQACYDGPAGTAGVGQCQAGSQTCGTGGVFGPCVGQVLPGTEIPGNAIDEDCDGQTPECTPDQTQACYSGPAGTAGVGLCQAGTRTCSAQSSFGACQGEVLPMVEVPDNGIDEDCDGQDATTGSGNRPPVAQAGPDQMVQVGDTVSLNGSQSSDPDNDPLTYQWFLNFLPPGSSTTLVDAETATPSFVADVPGLYEVGLSVSDGTDDSPVDTVVIRTPNVPPIAKAGPDMGSFLGQAVQLDGSESSDAHRDALTYRWTVISQPTDSRTTLSDPASAMPLFIGDTVGSYTLQLIVNDSEFDSTPDTTVIVVEESSSSGGVFPVYESPLPVVRAAWVRFRIEQGPEWLTGWDAVTGTPKPWMQGGRSQPFTGDPEAAARQFLSTYHDLFQMRNDLGDLTLEFLSPSDVDERLLYDAHLQFVQTYQGLPIFGGGIEVYLTPAGEVYLVHNYYAPEAVLAQVSLSPSLTAVQVAQLAEADYPIRMLYDLGGQPFTPEPATVFAAPELGLYRMTNEYFLAYRVVVGVMLYIIDANSGAMLLVSPLVHF